MLTREFLEQAMDVCINAGSTSFQSIQRRLRVGFVTARQLVDALETAGVLGPWDAEAKRQPALFEVAGRDAALAAVDQAIADGRVELTPVN